ncbi:Uncharacterized protein involved in exopolysaccharide biosynthesis [Sulfitobacter brevis]|uniref:Uncharacterized protein involved in exopolysaccharide biosynthesis n=1 Tax=Sulfitobacter brevis TaxID=74348 RepID=A0A1I2FD04_9RHOB|nr:exopolysaccharide transport family protein [Sulfitobacter brevis]SFF03115.1 Uncharacterized protein involved in exopolysaccharide biosynthesis [Sulfitobacter brevis]
MPNDWYRSRNAPLGTPRQDGVPDDTADELSLLSVALRHKVRLILTGIVATILAYAVLTQVTPTYRSSAQVLLEVQAELIIDIPNAVPEAPDGIATLGSAIILIRSPQVMRSVVEELGLTTRAEFNSTLRAPSLLDRVFDMISAGVDRVRQMLGFEAEPAGIGRDPVERAARALRSKVSVRSLGESRVIEISTESQSARLAAQISNAIAVEYIEQQIAMKAAAGAQVTQWLEERTNDARAQLEESERKLSEFGSEMIASERTSSMDLEAQLLEANTQLIALEQQLLELGAQRAEIANLRADGNYLTLASVVELPTVTTLVERLAALDNTIVNLTATYGDHSKTREAQETRRQLIVLLETESARLISGLDVRLGVVGDRKRDMAAKIRVLQLALVDMKQDDFRRDALTRDFDTARNVYERFLLRQKEMEQRGQFQSSGARLVAEAERPSAPVSPQKAQLALLAGIAAGGGMLVFLTIGEARRPGKVEVAAAESSDLVEYDQMGVLVTLPYLSDFRHPPDILRYFQQHSDSNLAISVHWLKSYLKPRSRNGTSLILVTSADQGEGKSTLSMLLAESFSRDFCTLLVYAESESWLADFAHSDASRQASFDLLSYSDDILHAINGEFDCDDDFGDRLGADIVILDAPAMPLSTSLLEIGQQADHVIFAAAKNRAALHKIRNCAWSLEQMGIAISALALTIVPRDAQEKLTQIHRPWSPLQLPKRKNT